jgi:plasmid stabilization system protein ParE
MTRVLEDAIEKVRKLPEDRQAYVAEVLEQIAAAGSDLFTVPDDHRAAVLEGLEQAERGEFVSDDEMAALWRKCGLRSCGTRRVLTPISLTSTSTLRSIIRARQRPSYGRFVRRAARYPGLGRETDIPGVRVFPTASYPYLVYHRVRGDEVIILHIRDGRRDAPEAPEL